MLSVVLDANVRVSAAIQRGPSHRIVQAWREQREFALVICPLLVDEVEDVLTMRPRLRRWIDIDLAREYLDVLRTFDRIASDPAPGPPITRDVNDDYLIALAREQGADLIVSGDNDLLEWPEQQPPVVTPETFERRLIALR
jgi:putative PIN family toxin of toxin-antitoxin system